MHCLQRGGGVDGGFFWFSDAQWARIEPLLPANARGKRRVDDRRVLSGIVLALKCGGRWADCSCDIYGLKKTLFNRFVSWSQRGKFGSAHVSTPVTPTHLQCLLLSTN